MGVRAGASVYVASLQPQNYYFKLKKSQLEIG